MLSDKRIGYLMIMAFLFVFWYTIIMFFIDIKAVLGSLIGFVIAVLGMCVILKQDKSHFFFVITGCYLMGLTVAMSVNFSIVKDLHEFGWPYIVGPIIIVAMAPILAWWFNEVRK